LCQASRSAESSSASAEDQEDWFILFVHYSAVDATGPVLQAAALRENGSVWKEGAISPTFDEALAALENLKPQWKNYGVARAKSADFLPYHLEATPQKGTFPEIRDAHYSVSGVEDRKADRESVLRRIEGRLRRLPKWPG
jgi:hypothetical protein